MDFSEERLLLREMAHRVHNEFASAMAIISLSAARSPSEEVKATLAAVRDRLYRYSLVHRALEAPASDSIVDVPSYLEELCEAIRRSKLGHLGLELFFAGCPALLHSEQCWRLGMIVSELITNSVRHAFKDRAGTIEVTLRRCRSLVECRVQDNGSGSAAKARPGQGRAIIARLSEGLGGELEQHFGPEGSLTILTFPSLSETGDASIDRGVAGRGRMPPQATAIP